MLDESRVYPEKQGTLVRVSHHSNLRLTPYSAR